MLPEAGSVLGGVIYMVGQAFLRSLEAIIPTCGRTYTPLHIFVYTWPLCMSGKGCTYVLFTQGLWQLEGACI